MHTLYVNRKFLRLLPIKIQLLESQDKKVNVIYFDLFQILAMKEKAQFQISHQIAP
eukprot:UN23895